VNNWLKEFENHRSSLAKQIAYALLRPFLRVEARRWLSDITVSAGTRVTVLRERGFPIESRRRWALAGLDISNSVILVQGTGSGRDVLTWARLRPKRIIATDLFAFDSWTEVSAYVASKWNVTCEFHQAALEDHAFLADGSIDACVSDAVFEHCRNLDAVLAETRRVLKPGGRLYASYGPLWFCPGGDHYSGRGEAHTVYNHLLLTPAEYKAYVETQRQDLEDCQNGYRYIELDLFSRMTSADFLRAYSNRGFLLDELILEVSSTGLRFRTMFPRLYERLRDATKDRCVPDDLIVKGNLIRAIRTDEC
jgi:SAM-dependent methyltransferase